MMQSVRTFLDLIRVEHTVFALPFAYVGMFLGAGGAPSAAQLLWVTVAMVAARSAGMSLNRLIDREIDARNPRTAARPLQSGRISARSTAFGAVLALLALGFAAWQLNAVVFALWPGALAFLVGYPYTKRFTWLSHFILGFTDGLAPMGAWVAVTGSFWLRSDLPAWLLLGALTVWIGGFDLIYACQDVDVDREQGLHSFPARFGIAAALQLARGCHVVTLALLAGVGAWFGLGWPFWFGLLVAASLFIWEHMLVRPDDLSRVDIAFFNMNGYISVTVLASVLAGLWLA